MRSIAVIASGELGVIEVTKVPGVAAQSLELANLRLCCSSSYASNKSPLHPLSPHRSHLAASCEPEAACQETSDWERPPICHVLAAGSVEYTSARTLSGVM